MNLEHCVLRVESLDGQPQGTGFVVAPRLAVTCAHVVEGCSAGPGDRLRVTFHISGTSIEAEVLADGWHPEEDVAFLRLPDKLPEGVQPAVMGSAKGSNGHRYQTLGFPEDGDVLERWPQGRIGGLVSVKNWKGKLLQLQGAEVDRGLSGAPVLDLDTDRVVGMITGYKGLGREQDEPQVRYAYAIPSETLSALRSEEVRLHLPQERSKLRIGAPFQAPPLPPHFVPRLDACQDLKTRLLAEDTRAPGVLVVSAIHGLGGIGKTVLATALAHDSEVQDRFPDGVLWATLGQEPDLLSLLSRWIRA